MKLYKLVALDMDGTLLNHHQQISAANRRWIGEAVDAGLTVSIATGRGIDGTLPYVEELNLASPFVTVNGSEVWASPGVLLKRHVMQVDVIERLHRMAVQYDLWCWAYTTDGVVHSDNWVGDAHSRIWMKFGFESQDEERLASVKNELQKWGAFEITNSHPTNLELNPRGVSKASGLMDICKRLGIEMSQVIAVGDSLNDLAMIRAAGLGVAMGNAQDEVKQAADLVTATNDEDGVAKVIRDVVLS